jgi:processive 1,2-diacylglycerol beta-glucosyltransferase
MRPRCLLHPENPALCRGSTSHGQRDDSTIAKSGQHLTRDADNLNNPGRAAVQIWAAGTGGGHLSVAEAVATAISERSQGTVSVALDDPVEDPIGRTARSLARAYGPLVRTSPALWGVLFRGFSKRGLSSTMDRFLLRQLAPAMAARTQARAPRVIVNCHPLLGPAANSAAQAARVGGFTPALITVMTDLVGGHQGWLAPRPDAILTATSEATDWCLNHGVPADLIRQTGLPVDPRLGEGAADKSHRRSARRELGLNPELLTVLVGGGAEGAGNLRHLARWLGASGLPLQAVFACGNNRRLQGWLSRRQPQSVATLGLSYQESLTPWLRAADIYLGKAGPSALAEAAAAGLALLVTDSLPGQEENNGAAVVAAGAALEIHGRRELLEILRRLCLPADPLLGQLQRGALTWARPGAALEAAEIILAFLAIGHSETRLQARSAAG